jgi:aminoglycoside phosphotransferase (APT) family kinase protein
MSDNQEEIVITLSLVRQLIAEQFPQYGHLSIYPVQKSGHDNRTFHLGDTMLIRLPSAKDYEKSVFIEQEYLPKLAKYLSLPIPAPIVLGKPSGKYPLHWSIYKYLKGESLNNIPLDTLNLEEIAIQLAHFLNKLYAIEASNGPIPSADNFYRGRDLIQYNAEMEAAIKKIQDPKFKNKVIAIRQKALNSNWDNKPVWVHGDFAMGNILLKDNKVSAIIYFGQMAIGNPACDLVVAWTFFRKKSQKFFMTHLNIDENTWARAKGWALWKTICWPVESFERNKEIIEEIVGE